MREYLYIFATIIFTVYGQLIVKWRILKLEPVPLINNNTLQKLIQLLFDPFIFSGLLAVIPAGFCWMAAISKLDLSYAYPFMGLTFVLVFIFSILFFGESLTLHKIIGLLFIVSGIFITSRSA